MYVCIFLLFLSPFSFFSLTPDFNFFPSWPSPPPPYHSILHNIYPWKYVCIYVCIRQGPSQVAIETAQPICHRVQHMLNNNSNQAINVISVQGKRAKGQIRLTKKKCKFRGWGQWNWNLRFIFAFFYVGALDPDYDRRRQKTDPAH